MKILTVVGARPQFVKAAMLSRAIARHNRTEVGEQVVEEIVHTGQHFDENMSQIFFNQMKIPSPVVNLGISAERHGEMTGRMRSKTSFLPPTM